MRVEGVANRLTGSEVNEDILVGQTSIGLGKVETHKGPTDECIDGTGVTNVRVAERESRKEQLKCFVDLFADIQVSKNWPGNVSIISK